MNIQNIVVLTEQLQLLGFGNLGYSLMKRTCFKPERFSILQKVTRGKDKLTFEFMFEKSGIKDSYILVYYDAILQKEIAIKNITVNGINTAFLEEQMGGIDWKITFQPDEKIDWNAKDEATWDKEQIIEKIVEDLMSLKKMQEGKEIALSLIYKYWADIPYEELVGPISPLRNKSEISQRFYFLEGNGISVDEAYRFLQNRWLERQINNKRKQVESSGDTQAFNNEGLLDSGVSPKKRFSKPRGKK